MNKKKKGAPLILAVGLILLFSMTFSAASLGSFPRRSCVDIKTALNSSSVNISTINYPNLTTAISNQEMTKVGKTFNYTFCQTEDTGTYIYDYFDDEGNVFVNDFIITPDGNQIDTGESMMYIWILIFIGIFLAVSVFVAIVTPYGNIMENTRKGPAVKKVSKLKYLKLMAIWFSYGLLLMFVTVLAGMTNNYIQFSEMKGMFTSIYRWLSLLGYGVTVGMVWFIFANLGKDIILNKVILREGKALLRDL